MKSRRQTQKDYMRNAREKREQYNKGRSKEEKFLIKEERRLELAYKRAKDRKEIRAEYNGVVDRLCELYHAK